MMPNKIKLSRRTKHGSVLLLVAISLVILAALGGGLLTVSYGVRHQAVKRRNEAAAMLAAEAGCEAAVFKMSQQPDMLAALASENFDPAGSINFEDSSCEYRITFDSFIGARPIYSVVSEGRSGMFNRTVELKIVQAIDGWSSTHRIPTGDSSTIRWPFVDGEVLDIPIHVNSSGEPGDTEPDMDISGNPQFLQAVSFSESRYSDGGVDKYSGDMDCFEGGVAFNQPDNAIKNEDIVTDKVEMFKDATNSNFSFSPAADDNVDGGNGHPAVQLEFYVDDGVGYVRITEDCTVVGYGADSERSETRDYKIKPGTDSQEFEKYDIYAYHYIPDDADKRYIQRIDDPTAPIYVTPTYGGVDGAPCAQIFVEGNVIIGSRSESAALWDYLNTIKGKIRVVATGNIWLAKGL